MGNSFLKRYNGTDFITSIRAIAATLVIIIHTDALSAYGKIGENITLSGKYGVNIFFVLSGFAIASSLSQKSDYRDFFLRRFFRIAPTYYLAIAVFSIALFLGAYSNGWKQQFEVDLDAYNVAMHFLFLSMFDYRIANSIIGIEWTIPIEIFWYLLFPALISASSSRKRMAAIFFSLLLLDAISQAAASATETPNTWLPFSYGWQFYLGFIAFTSREFITSRRHTAILASFAAFAFCTGIALNFGAPLVLLSLALFIASFDQSASPRVTRMLCSRPLIFLGSISYSTYLFHMGFVQISQHALGTRGGLEVFVLTLILTTAWAALAYRFVEMPSNSVGASIVQHLNSSRKRGSSL